MVKSSASLAATGTVGEPATITEVVLMAITAVLVLSSTFALASVELERFAVAAFSAGRAVALEDN